MGTYRPVTPEEQLRALAAGHVGVLERLARMQLGALAVVPVRVVDS